MATLNFTYYNVLSEGIEAYYGSGVITYTVTRNDVRYYSYHITNVKIVPESGRKLYYDIRIGGVSKLSGETSTTKNTNVDITGTVARGLTEKEGIRVVGSVVGVSGSTAQARTVVPPVAKITYSANGGTGGPGPQFKEIDAAITLSTTQPTRDGYTFQGWATSNSASDAQYVPGAQYSGTTSVTLYAVWWKNPAFPTLTVRAVRCDANGNGDDEGTYCKITAKWSVDTTSSVVTSNSLQSISGSYSQQGVSGSKSISGWSGGTSGTSGTATAIIGGTTDSTKISIDSQYLITVSVRDKANTSTRTAICTKAHFVLDFRAGGNAIGIGTVAPESGVEIGWRTQVDGSVDIRGATIDRDAAVSGSSTVYEGRRFAINDIDGEALGVMRCLQRADGTIGMQTIAWNEPVGGGDAKYNIFALYVGKDGTSSYSISSPAAFRTALGLDSVETTLTLSNTSSGDVYMVYNPTHVTLYVYSVRLSNALASTRSVQIATIPSGYRPTHWPFAQAIGTTANFPHGVYVSINPSNGAVFIGNLSGSQLAAGSHYWSATITYAI